MKSEKREVVIHLLIIYFDYFSIINILFYPKNRHLLVNQVDQEIFHPNGLYITSFHSR